MAYTGGIWVNYDVGFEYMKWAQDVSNAFYNVEETKRNVVATMYEMLLGTT